MGLGYDVVEVEYEAWIGKVPLLSIDVDPVDADASVTIAHEVVGDLDASLEWLVQLPPARPGWPADMAAQHRWLSLIQVKQVRRRFGLYGTDLGEHERVDPPAHYFGVPVVGARSAAELARALKEALVADHPTVIEARVDPSHYLDTVYA